MTKRRKAEIRKNLHAVHENIKIMNIPHALGAADALTIVGFGLPFLSKPYFCAKHLQHILYYHHNGERDLGLYDKDISTIDSYLRHAQTTED